MRYRITCKFSERATSQFVYDSSTGRTRAPDQAPTAGCRYPVSKIPTIGGDWRRHCDDQDYTI